MIRYTIVSYSILKFKKRRERRESAHQIKREALLQNLKSNCYNRRIILFEYTEQAVNIFSKEDLQHSTIL